MQQGVRPHRFAILIAALHLEPGKRYELSARMNHVPQGATSVVGICADLWGNKNQKFLKLSPCSEYRIFQMEFIAPLNGKCNLIIKNVCRFDKLQIDWIKVVKQEKHKPGEQK